MGLTVNYFLAYRQRARLSPQGLYLKLGEVRVRLYLKIYLVMMAAAASLFAQAGLGTITGVVVDSTGASVPGAKVQLTETASQSARHTTSNEAGLFTFPSVVVGKYRITITAAGFKTKDLENLTVNGFQQLALDQIALEIGEGAATVVTVTAEQQLVKDSAVRLETIQARQVSDMPLNGRSWPTLLKIVAGSNPTVRQGVTGREYSAGAPYGDYRINGKSASQTQVNLDGGSIVDHGSDTRTTVAPSLESVQEISVLTNNFQAEYGVRGGAVINVITKSGTNQFHGGLFEYLRNEALNANTWDGNFLGQPRQRYRFNYFGANIGGPIKKNKLFFFYNFENFKVDTPAASTLSRVPTLAERNGDFSQTRDANGTRPIVYTPGTQFSGTPVPYPNNVIPASTVTALGKAILNIFPAPNNPLDPVNNYILQTAAKNPRQTHTGKVDWNLGDNTRMYVRYTDDEGTLVDRNFGGNNSGNLPFGALNRPRPDRSLAVSGTHTFSPTLVLESLVSWSYDFVRWDPAEPDKITKQALGLSALPLIYKPFSDIVPTIDTGTYPMWNFNRMPETSKAVEWQISAIMSWTHGTHFVKFGGQTIRNQKVEQDASYDKGLYDFKPSSGSPFDTGYGPSNTLLGALASFQQIENINRKDAAYRDYHFFIQDTWKARRNLTFDYGVRFYHIPSEYNTHPEQTLDAVFLPSRYDPAKAPRYYVPDPKNPALVIDPAFPNSPLGAGPSGVLRFALVPGSGDPLNGVVQLGKGGVGKSGIPNPKYILLAPRGGFAWSPRGSDKTVIRGGFGWAYNRNAIADTVAAFENGLGNTANLVQTSLATMSAATTAQRLAPRSLGVRDEAGGRVPTIYDYSVSFQRQLPYSLIADVAYIGNIQRHQPINFNLNAIPLGTAFRPEFVDPRSAGYNFAGPVTAANPGPLPGSNTLDPLVMRPYRGFDSLTMTANVANNTYNSLQLALNKRFGHGLTLQATYSLARTSTQQENFGLYSYNWKDYTGYVLNTDRRHIFNLNYSYDLPRLARTFRFDNALGRGLLNNWRFAHLLQYYSGQAYSPTFAVQQSGTTTNVDLARVFLGTPDLTPRVGISGDPNGVNKDTAHQFDPAALTVPSIFPQGVGAGLRNFIDGRGEFSNDMSVFKEIHITEKHFFELRANFYNAFNQPRWTVVNSNVQFKAKGRTLGDGFTVFNTPEAVVGRLAANTNPATAFNQYRSGVGHVNLTTVEPMRIIELSVKFHF
jgi:hypothetical protein